MHYSKNVTVVITTRNRADVLPRALRSALLQTHSPVEVIVVVDGADSATSDFLLSVKDARVRSILLDQQVGGCAARNAGVEAADCDWIAFLDDDDEWMPTKLEAQMKIASQSPAQYPIVSCRVSAVTDDGRKFLWPARKLATGEHLSDYLLSRDRWVQGEGLITTSMILAPRELFQRVPFRAGLRRHQEWDWLLRAAASAEVDVLIAWDTLATWHIERKQASISRLGHWQTSFNWIITMRRLVTPRAYASFLMVFVSAIAAREGDRAAFRIIVEEARRHGQPGSIDYILMAAMWLLPQTTRRRLRNLFTPEVQPA
jgi:glycosyltransferase involved in cell wall biosynthesis